MMVNRCEVRDRPARVADRGKDVQITDFNFMHGAQPECSIE